MSTRDAAPSRTARGPGTKVKAFQFIEGKPQLPPEPIEQDKENYCPPRNIDSRLLGSQTSKELAQEPHENAPLSPVKAFPSTPATRLPLSDLLGNADSAHIKGANTSPEEHISWLSVRSPKSSGSKKTPARKNKKRPRSSSPPNTSQRQSAKRDILDLDSLKHDLRTPEIDPAADLWNRYSINTDKNHMSGISAATIANINYPSSPYSLDIQNGNVGGLRRWTSCGMEWPSSKAKRRKINHTSAIREQVEEALNEASISENLGSAKPSKSKIAFLIERIQESRSKSHDPPEQKPPSSSSPLPDGKDSLSQRREEPSSPTKPAHPLPEGEAADSSGTTTKKEPNSSSFGSDDVDLNIVDIKSAKPQSLENNDGARCHVDIVPVAERHEEMETLDDDEFDDEIDMTADDFDVVASLCDTRETRPSTLR